MYTNSNCKEVYSIVPFSCIFYAWTRAAPETNACQVLCSPTPSLYCCSNLIQLQKNTKRFRKVRTSLPSPVRLVRPWKRCRKKKALPQSLHDVVTSIKLSFQKLQIMGMKFLGCERQLKSEYVFISPERSHLS